MQELKENLEIVAGYANDHAKNAQERYAYYYNLRARDKHFSVGDQVIVLTPDYNFSWEIADIWQFYCCTFKFCANMPCFFGLDHTADQ